MFQTPPITKNLIIINVLLFFAATVGERWNFNLNDVLGLHFMLASDFHVFQLFTYMFMHANWEHIFFNLFMFWMFGRTMESVWGPRRFLIFYLVCGVGAGVIQEVVQFAQFYMEGLNVASDYLNVDGVLIAKSDYLNAWTTVGASGAIYGILLGFGMTFPNERILLLIPPIPLKAKYMVIGSVVLELILGMSTSTNVAHFAHLGGMLFGWFLIRHWRHKENEARYGFTTWEEYKPKKESFFERLKKQVKEKTDERQSHEENEKEVFTEHSDDYRYNRRSKEQQEEIDRILEKIKRSGYETLTNDEKKTLFDANKR